jgi:chemotaxis signal transduction protein
MTDKTLDCIVLPADPAPFILPKACVAEAVPGDNIESISGKKVEWMVGHVDWNNQRLPIIDLQALIYSEKTPEDQIWIAILNPIANAARRSYTAVICPGEPQDIEIASQLDYSDSEISADKRYIERTLSWQDKDYVLPRLSSLSVAFTYI